MFNTRYSSNHINLDIRIKYSEAEITDYSIFTIELKMFAFLKSIYPVSQSGGFDPPCTPHSGTPEGCHWRITENIYHSCVGMQTTHVIINTFIWQCFVNFKITKSDFIWKMIVYTYSVVAVDLQLSIKKMGQTDRQLQFVPCIDPSTYPIGRLEPYNAKFLYCQLINLIPKNFQHILLPDLCQHLPSIVHESPIWSQKSIRLTKIVYWRCSMLGSLSIRTPLYFHSCTMLTRVSDSLTMPIQCSSVQHPKKMLIEKHYLGQQNWFYL
jgi:hypothetical protein